MNRMPKHCFVSSVVATEHNDDGSISQGRWTPACKQAKTPWKRYGIGLPDWQRREDTGHEHARS
jgi:hypothetical protein